MKVSIILLGLFAFANCVFADECYDVAESCLEPYQQALLESGEEEPNCAMMKEMEDCWIRIIETCLADLEEAERQKDIDSITRRVDEVCATQSKRDSDDDGFTDEEREMIECLSDESKLMAYVGECAENVMNHITSGSIMASNSLRDNTCQAFLSIARCVSGKVGSVCGEPVEKPFFYGMMMALKQEDPRAASSPECAEAISEAEMDDEDEDSKRKRRSVQHVSFAKLMP